MDGKSVYLSEIGDALDWCEKTWIHDKKRGSNHWLNLWGYKVTVMELVRHEIMHGKLKELEDGSAK